MATFSQNFSTLSLDALRALAEERKEQGWRYVQILAVNTETGVDLVYSFMKDGELANFVIRNVTSEDTVPSISDLYLEAFVCENEIHDLFGLSIAGIAIDFGGTFYDLAVKEPMTIISPEQRAAREKARKIAEAKAAKEAKAARAAAANADYLSTHPEKTEGAKPSKVIEPADAALEAKLAGMDPEKAARVKAAMAAKEAKAARAAAANVDYLATHSDKADEEAAKQAELEQKLANMDPEKAAKVRAAMEAKAKKAAEQKDGE